MSAKQRALVARGVHWVQAARDARRPIVLFTDDNDTTHVRDAVAVGADLVVAQGAEAGGHGATRGTLSLVPEVADHLATHAPDTLLLAAGGIGDGRGLAAALMLGADGVLLGTRLWAAHEALVSPGHHDAIVSTPGDGTLRTTVADIARQIDWPQGYTARIRRNAFTDRWHGHEAELLSQIETEGPKYRQAFCVCISFPYLFVFHNCVIYPR